MSGINIKIGGDASSLIAELRRIRNIVKETGGELEDVLGKDLDNIFDKLTDDLKNGVPNAVDSAIGSIQDLSKEFGDEMPKALRDTIVELGNFADKIGEELPNATKDTIAEFQKLQDVESVMDGVIGKLKQGAKALMNAFLNPRKIIMTLATTLSALVVKWVKNIDNMTLSTRELNKELKQSRKDLEDAFGRDVSSLRSLSVELASCKKGTEAWNIAKEKIVENYGKYHEGLDEEIEKVGNLSGVYDELLKSMRDIYEQEAYQQFIDAQNTLAEEVVNSNLKKIREKLDVENNATGAQLYGDLLYSIFGGGDFNAVMAKIKEQFSDIKVLQIGSAFGRISKAMENQAQALQNAKDVFGIDTSEVEQVEQTPVEDTIMRLDELQRKIKEKERAIEQLIATVQNKGEVSQADERALDALNDELNALTTTYSKFVKDDLTKAIFSSVNKIDKNALLQNSKKVFDEVSKQLQDLRDKRMSLVPSTIDLDKAQEEIDEYLAMWGTYEEKKEAITRIYNKKIAESNGAVAMTFREELEAELKALSQEQLANVVKWGSRASGVIGDLGKALSELGASSGNKQLENLGDTLSSLSQNVDAAAQGVQEYGGWWGAIIGGLKNALFQTLEGWAHLEQQEQIAKNSMRDYFEELQLQLLKLDTSKFDTIFGTESMAKASEAFRLMNESLKAYNDYMSQVYIKQEGFGNINEIDAYFAGRQYDDYLKQLVFRTKDYTGWQQLWGKEDKYMNLFEYSQLNNLGIWDEDGVFNVENAKAFLATNKVIDDTIRSEVQHAIDLKEQYEEAEKALDDYLNSIVGNMASDLANAIWDGVVNGGKSAWDTWQDISAEAIANIAKQMLQEMLIEMYLDKYKERMQKAFQVTPTGDQSQYELIYANFLDIMSDINDEAPEFIEMLQNLAQSIYDSTEEAGLAEDSLERSAQAKGIAQASQDSVDELNGRMTAIQGHTFMINENVTIMTDNVGAILRSLTNIEGYASNLTRLSNMESNITAISNAVDDIRTKGVTMR